MTEKQIILFDLDGTISDPNPGIAKGFAKALAAYGIQIDDLKVLDKFVGPPMRQSFIEFYGFTAQQAEDASAIYRAYYNETGLYENTIYPGMAELLAALRAAGKAVVMATSKPIPFAEKVADYFGIRRHFTFIAGSELDGRRGAKDEVIRYALEQAGAADLSQAVMVGDRKYDLVGARKVGLDAIGVLYGYGSRAELEEAGATVIVETVAELRQTLLGTPYA